VWWTTATTTLSHLCWVHETFNWVFADPKLPRTRLRLCCSHDALNCLFADSSHSRFWPIHLQWIFQITIRASMWTADNDSQLPTTNGWIFFFTSVFWAKGFPSKSFPICLKATRSVPQLEHRVLHQACAFWPVRIGNLGHLGEHKCASLMPSTWIPESWIVWRLVKNQLGEQIWVVPNISEDSEVRGLRYLLS
jgi:hypothetical protein